MFLLYSPLNQGLKLMKMQIRYPYSIRFLLYSPLNQGLKRNDIRKGKFPLIVFTLQSIKSRIET